jgi:antirestriction protein ArdC
LSESLSRLEQAVGEIQDSETFRRYLDAQAKFYKYSWGNVLLILGSKPEATHVAGYRTWQSLNRYVRRGEKGIRILVPMSRKVTPEPSADADSNEDERQERRVFFGLGHVWDISQTEGEPLPSVEVPELTGQEGRPLHEKLVSLAHTEGLNVESSYDLLPAGVMGAYDHQRRAIMLREAAPLQMTKTLAHELGHHFAEARESNPEEETVAESIAYVVCSHFGLDTGERSVPYVAVWSREPRVFKAALTRIQTISSLIIERIEPSGSAEPTR